MKIAVDARTLGSRPSGVGMYLNDFLKELIKYKEFEFILLRRASILSTFRVGDWKYEHKEKQHIEAQACIIIFHLYKSS